MKNPVVATIPISDVIMYVENETATFVVPTLLCFDKKVVFVDESSLPETTIVL